MTTERSLDDFEVDSLQQTLSICIPIEADYLLGDGSPGERNDSDSSSIRMEDDLFGEILHELFDWLEANGVRILGQKNDIVFLACVVILNWFCWEKESRLSWWEENAWLGLEETGVRQRIFCCESRKDESVCREAWKRTKSCFGFDVDR